MNQEQAILERIKVSRGTSDSTPVEQPEESQIVNVSEDAPIEDVNEPEAQVNEEVATEIEESEYEENAASYN